MVSNPVRYGIGRRYQLPEERLDSTPFGYGTYRARHYLGIVHGSLINQTISKRFFYVHLELHRTARLSILQFCPSCSSTGTCDRRCRLRSF